jgi:cobyrinic acid a,c-diamide synthase
VSCIGEEAPKIMARTYSIVARTCPALFIAGPASGQGKTTLVAALARHHRNQGRRVRVFKTGPDFLDPMVLSRAAGTPVESLDLWMVGETTVGANSTRRRATRILS